MIKSFSGLLEVDTDRGVIYFHESGSGITILRICRLGEIPETFTQIDITPIREASLAIGFSYESIGGLIHRDSPTEEIHEEKTDDNPPVPEV